MALLNIESKQISENQSIVVAGSILNDEAVSNIQLILTARPNGAIEVSFMRDGAELISVVPLFDKVGAVSNTCNITIDVRNDSLRAMELEVLGNSRDGTLRTVSQRYSNSNIQDIFG